MRKGPPEIEHQGVVSQELPDPPSFGYMETTPQSSGPVDRAFATTQWSVVLAASTSPASRGEALERLCRAYWSPLYACIRRRGYNLHDAQDLTQSFLAALLAGNGLAKVHPASGKFRSFLVGSLNHFLANEHDRRTAAKRGGGRTVISLDEIAAEDSRLLTCISHENPEKSLDRHWALTVLNRALQELKREFIAAGRETVFEQLKRWLEEETQPREYTVLASELHMSPGAVAVAVHRMRQRYRQLVRREIAETVASPEEIEEELRHLLTVWAG
jgi:DNA-directed RNA polymerase specialized sigma24 family protein